MSNTTNVISIGSLNVQPGSGYFATFQMSFIQPEGSISRSQCDQEGSIATNVGLGVSLYFLQVVVEPADADTVDARRRALLREFDQTRGPVTVVIENAAGTARRRYMQFVVRKADQMENAHGKGFAVTLETYDDGARWQGLDVIETTWTLDASGTREITVLGDLDVYPTYTMTPNTARATPVWPYRRDILVEWRSPYGGVHSIDVTGGGLDTQAMIAAGKVTDGANMAVMMNGRMRRHWYAPDNGQPFADPFGSTGTRLWINMRFEPAVWPVLAKRVSESDTTWAVEEDDGLPAMGVLRAGAEYVAYASRAPGYLYGVRRGLYGSTAAEHEPGNLTHYQGAGAIYYGPSGALADNLKDAEYLSAVAPVFLDGQGSSNQEWRFETFAANGAPASWAYSAYLRGLGFVEESDETGTPGTTWAYPWAAMGLLAGWTGTTTFTTRYAVPLRWVEIRGRRQSQLSPAAYPNAPVLLALSEDYRSRTTVWEASDGVSREGNLAFNRTSSDIRPPDPFGTAIGYNRLSWGVSQSNHVQADIQWLRAAFDDAYTPVVTMMAEETDYDLDATLANVTTGESLRVQFPNLTPGKSLVIDSQSQTVVYTGDGSNQYAAVRRDVSRPKFLRLVPGVNTFAITENGMGQITIKVAYRPRWYA